MRLQVGYTFVTSLLGATRYDRASASRKVAIVEQGDEAAPRVRVQGRAAADRQPHPKAS